MRLLEGLGLRVKDLDFGRGEITVRQGNGQKHRVTMLPGTLFQACSRLEQRAGTVALARRPGPKVPNPKRASGITHAFRHSLRCCPVQEL